MFFCSVNSLHLCRLCIIVSHGVLQVHVRFLKALRNSYSFTLYTAYVQFVGTHHALGSR